MAKKREAIVLGTLLLLMPLLLAFFYFRVYRNVEPDKGESTPVVNTDPTAPELKQEVVADGLSNPWDIGFLPDGKALITEREGKISVLENGSARTIHEISDIYARGEGGLLGLTVDPSFSENRFIYACYVTEGDVRLSRWKVNQEVTALTDEADIITGMPVNTTTFPGRHSGCRPRFGADGFLWVGTGDVAIGTTPQDPKSLGGKVLRVDRDGKAVKGNLGAPFDPRIFNYGHRNIQGMAMLDEPINGNFGFSVEHGSGRDDEVNALVAGNFGRDPVPGYSDDAPMTDKTKFPDAIDALWSSGQPTIAPSGATILSGDKWGAYEERLAMAVLKDKYLQLFTIDDAGKLKEEQQLLKDVFGRLRSAVMGPDQALYLTTDNGGGRDKVIKITPQ